MQERQMQEQGAISIQAVWQILGQKEWQLQMAAAQLAQVQQEAATLRQRLTEALTELAPLQEKHAATLIELAALKECTEAESS